MAALTNGPATGSTSAPQRRQEARGSGVEGPEGPEVEPWTAGALEG